MKMWWGPRLGRGDFFFALIAINAAYLALAYLLGDGVALNFLIGPRSTPGLWGAEPAVLSALKAGFDIVLFSLIYRRLQDAALPGWYAAAFPLAVFGLGAMGLPAIAFGVFLVGLLAVFFLKPSVGPNAFGPDPRGWTSVEQKQNQEERLRSGD